jgi:hypothetical protein
MYTQLQLSLSQLQLILTTESPLDSPMMTNSAESLARAQDLLARAQNIPSQTDSLNSSLKTEDLTELSAGVRVI